MQIIIILNYEKYLTMISWIFDNKIAKYIVLYQGVCNSILDGVGGTSWGKYTSILMDFLFLLYCVSVVAEESQNKSRP